MKKVGTPLKWLRKLQWNKQVASLIKSKQFMSDIIFNRVKVYGPNKEAKEFIHTLSNMLSDCTINGSTVEFMTYCEPAFYILETIKLSNSRLSLLLDYKSRNGRLNGFVYANNGKYLNIITNKGKIPSPTLPIEKNQT